MGKAFKRISAVALIAVLFIMLFTNASYYNRFVQPNEGDGYLVYSGSVSFSDTASGAIYYTQAMYIGPLNANNGYAQFQCSEVGTEDVNVFMEYSNDYDVATASWKAGTTDADLDAVGTTLVEDTLGVAEGTTQVKYKGHIYMRYKFVLGSANNSGATITWSVFWEKPEGLKGENVGQSGKNTPTS